MKKRFFGIFIILILLNLSLIYSQTTSRGVAICNLNKDCSSTSDGFCPEDFFPTGVKCFIADPDCPASAPTACTITRTIWSSSSTQPTSVTTINSNQDVYMYVETSGCNGKDANFEVDIEKSLLFFTWWSAVPELAPVTPPIVASNKVVAHITPVTTTDISRFRFTVSINPTQDSPVLEVSPTSSGGGGGVGCVPQCSGKQCGADGCGGSCGSCSSGLSCNSNGQCVSSSSCVPSPAGTNNERNFCSDGLDNDCDNKIDSADPDCQVAGCIKNPAGTTSEVGLCSDGINNDCDLFGADSADPDCATTADGSCTDTIDNDVDGCVNEMPDCSDGKEDDFDSSTCPGYSGACASWRCDIGECNGGVKTITCPSTVPTGCPLTSPGTQTVKCSPRNEAFPFFTIFNVGIVLLLLTCYYSWNIYRKKIK